METKQLYTKFAEQLDCKNVLQDYPRPQLVRDSFQNLNGVWKYAIRNDEKFDCQMDGEILVPFSPESALSGVNRTLLGHQFLHYCKKFEIAKAFFKGRVILHFGAVDCICQVFVNRKKAGSHVGGFNAFSMDITDFCTIGQQNELYVIVQDFTGESSHSRGKQSAKRGKIWYTPQSGIWQTVWIESVQKKYIQKIEITPNFDKQSVYVEVVGNESLSNLVVEVFDANQSIAREKVLDKGVELHLKNFKEWNCQTPFLYDLVVSCDTDYVESYFGMRKFGIEKDANGFARLTLNNKPIFHNGLLDQGYFPDGLLTPPSDDAMVNDILTMKQLGFNMLRKHIKVEPMRWYFHCDRLGMLVWQDMVNGGSKYNPFATMILPFLGIHVKDNKRKFFARQDKGGQEQYYKELSEMIGQLYNCTSICTWVPFNEGWGQFDSEKAFEFVKALDKTRYVDHASGWHDQKISDFASAHVYFSPIKVKLDERVFAVTEFGGFSCYIKENSFNQQKFYGYKKFTDQKKFQSAYKNLFEKQIVKNIPKGLSACVYTQLSDVEDEVNGLLTYDRKILKLDKQFVQQLNSKIKL